MRRHGRENHSGQRLSRRAVVRGGLLGAAGAAGAALIGCGEDEGPRATPTPRPAATPGPAATPDPAAVKQGGVLRESLGAQEPVSFDIHSEIFFYSLWPITMMYNQVLKFDQYEADAIVPDLASSFEVPEPDRIVFTLHDATFHDGTPFTSEDVKTSIERIKSPPEGVRSPRQGQFAILESIETPDDRTAVFHMTRPSASFFGTLGHMTPAIYSTKDMLGGFDFTREVNGTGPYMLDRVDAGTVYVQKRNPNYFREGMPYLDGWEWNIIPEAVANFAAFQARNLDMFGPNTPQTIEIESTMPDATVVTAPGTTYWATTIATQTPPWNDERIWTAVGLAISKQDFNQVQYQGTAEIGAPLPPSSKWSLSEEELLRIPGYKGLGDGRESDMEARWTEARRLLDAAGIPEGQTVRVLSWQNFENWALVFADGLQHAGLTPELNLVELGTYNERLAARDFGDMAANSRTAVFPDPTPVFADSYIQGAGRHYTDLVIPEVEDLFIQQDMELDEARRYELQHRMQTAYLELYPAEIACFTITSRAFHNNVKDYGVQYGGLFQARKHEEIWLDR